MLVRVDPAVLVTDGDDLHSAAIRLRSAVASAGSSLSSTQGMAGDDPNAEDFAGAYDDSAQQVLDEAAAVVGHLSALDNAIAGTARAYDLAEGAGAGRAGSAISASGSAISADASSVPTALGAGMPGLLGDVAGFVQDALWAAGIQIPNGDPGKLNSAADAWSSLADDVRSVKDSVSSSLTALAGMDIPQSDDILACRDKLEEFLRLTAESADGLRGNCSDQAEAISAAHSEILWLVGQMVAEIAISAGLGIVLGAVTAGLGTLAAGANVARVIASFAIKILAVINRLRALTAARSALLRGAVRVSGEAARGAIAAVVVTASVDAVRADESGYEQRSLAGAGLGALLSPFAGSPVSAGVRGLGGRAAVSDIAGGLVEGAAGQGVGMAFGEDFNLAAVALGGAFAPGAARIDAAAARVTPRGGASGGATGGASGGASGSNATNATTPTLGATGGAAAPGTSGVSPTGGTPAGGTVGGNAPQPAPAGGGATSGGGGGGIRTDSSAPQPGAGSATGGQAAQSGGGVRTDSSAPQPGAGGGSATNSGGSTPVEVPSGGASQPTGGGASSPSAAPTPGAPAAPDAAPPMAPDTTPVSAPSGGEAPEAAPTTDTTTDAAEPAASPEPTQPADTTPDRPEAPTAQGETADGSTDTADGPTDPAGDATSPSDSATDVGTPEQATGPSEPDASTASDEAHPATASPAATEDPDPTAEPTPDSADTAEDGPATESPADSDGAAAETAAAPVTAEDVRADIEAAAAVDSADVAATGSEMQDAIAAETAAAQEAAAQEAAAADAAAEQADAADAGTADPADAAPPRDPAVLQPLTDQQLAILHGDARSGAGWHRHVETADEIKAHIRNQEILANHGHMNDAYLPNDGAGTVPSAADGPVAVGRGAEAIGYDPTEVWGHETLADGSTRPLDRDGWEARNVDADGNLRWAPNDGASAGSRIIYTDGAAFLNDFGTLQLDRLGATDRGSYFGVGGGTFDARALPPGQASTDELWEFDFRQLPAGWEMEIARISPAYGRDGGGLQLVIRNAAGEGQTIEQLLGEGVIENVRLSPVLTAAP
jgi:hypothetical protein